MTVKYIPVFIKNIEDALEFFITKLGFKMASKIRFDDDTDCTLIQINNEEQFLGLMEDPNGAGFKSKIILSTDDCLKDYHSLKMAGVIFENQPRYLQIGLAAEFLDDCGNQYTLLEERNYNEL